MGRRKEEEHLHYSETRPVIARGFIDPETGKRFVAKDANSWLEQINKEGPNKIWSTSSQDGPLPTHSRRHLDGSLPTHKPAEWKEIQ